MTDKKHPNFTFKNNTMIDVDTAFVAPHDFNGDVHFEGNIAVGLHKLVELRDPAGKAIAAKIETMPEAQQRPWIGRALTAVRDLGVEVGAAAIKQQLGLP